jgi:diguanylate cyclase (GGDEF)-like protein
MGNVFYSLMTEPSGTHPVSNAASRMEERNDAERLRVSQFMRSAALEIERATSVALGIQLMKSAHSTHAVVVRDARTECAMSNVMGVLQIDELEHISMLHPNSSQLSVCDVLRGAVVPLSVGCSLREAVRLSTATHHHAFPVVDGQTVVGLVTDKDLLAAVQGRLSGMNHVAQRLKDEARHDALTGLANRRYFDTTLDDEVLHHERLGHGLGLLLLDVDLFKAINDQYGHPRGDLVLQELATRLRRSVRSTDFVARIGGEEFAIIAGVHSKHALIGLAEKIRTCIAREKFRAPSRDRSSGTEPIALDKSSRERFRSEPPLIALDVTVSVGVAFLEGKIDSPHRLYRAADEALYVSKRSGRNHATLGHYQSSRADLPAAPRKQV